MALPEVQRINSDDERESSQDRVVYDENLNDKEMTPPGSSEGLKADCQNQDGARVDGTIRGRTECRGNYVYCDQYSDISSPAESARNENLQPEEDDRDKSIKVTIDQLPSFAINDILQPNYGMSPPRRTCVLMSHFNKSPKSFLEALDKLKDSDVDSNSTSDLETPSPEISGSTEMLPLFDQPTVHPTNSVSTSNHCASGSQLFTYVAENSKTEFTSCSNTMPVSKPEFNNYQDSMPVPRPSLTNSPARMPVSRPRITNSPARMPVSRPRITNSPARVPVPRPSLTNSPARMPVPRPSLTNTSACMPVQRPRLTNSQASRPVPIARFNNCRGTRPVVRQKLNNCQDTISVPNLELNNCQDTMSIPRHGLPNYQDTMPPPRPRLNNYHDTMPVRNPGSNNYQDTMSAPNPGSNNYQETMSVPNPGLNNYQDPTCVPFPMSGLNGYQGNMPIPMPAFNNYQDTMPIPMPGFNNYQNNIPFQMPGFNNYNNTFPMPMPGFNNYQNIPRFEIPGLPNYMNPMTVLKPEAANCVNALPFRMRADVTRFLSNMSVVMSGSLNSQDTMQSGYDEETMAGQKHSSISTESASSMPRDAPNGPAKTTSHQAERNVKRAGGKVNFTQRQKDGLNAAFSSNNYINKERADLLGQELNLTAEQIAHWFQKKRGVQKKLEVGLLKR